MIFSMIFYINSFNYKDLEAIKLTSLHQLSLFYLDAKSPEWNNLKEENFFLENLKIALL